ncbi:hypothetical protein MGA447_2414 [Enterococcus faecalis]|nr:hypothetical protein HMPREF1334_03089 [Enterococcus faecalis ERV41]EJV10112.1 hypothetical protein HMPREF1335_00482 [Enterococcus faecalis ERV62]EPH97573.1 hypothetical protein D921_00735 [Enterococcus faecalis F01966]KDE18521.1 hypothetical protein HMPREF2097_00434 [Enterococcus faecalis 918]OSH07052.1 hypothetical protein ELS84_2586 [Enterococcus faecalis]
MKIPPNSFRVETTIDRFANTSQNSTAFRKKQVWLTNQSIL